MFWRKQRAAIETFHPLHQGLIWQRGLAAALRPADWEQLIQSLSGHRALVRRGRWQPPVRTWSALVPLIRVVAADMRPDGELGITADLRGPNVPGKIGPARQLPVRRPIRSVTEWYTHDPWLRLRAELRDGSVLDLTVLERTRHRKVHKVNPRGKHKTKTKSKSVQRVSVSRRLPRGAAVRRPASPPPPWLAVRVRDGQRTVIRSSAKITVGPRFDEHALPEHILMVVAEPFRWTPPGTARPARRPR